MKFFTAILIILLCSKGFSQADSLSIKNKKNSFISRAALPISLVAVGSLMSGSHFEKEFQRELISRVDLSQTPHYEDYTRYVPIAQMYIADIAGIKAKNHWFDQSKNLLISTIFTDWLVFRLKDNTFKGRPFNEELQGSFPSGHTSYAFSTASVFYHEFKDSSPTLAYSGYLFAVTTAGFRVARNSHWLSDVVVGAGIAILVTEVVYYFDPLIKWNPFKSKKNAILLPSISNGSYGLHFAMNL